MIENVTKEKLSLMRKYNVEFFIFFLICSCVYITRLYVGSNDKMIEVIENNTRAMTEMKETIKTLQINR